MKNLQGSYQFLRVEENEFKQVSGQCEEIVILHLEGEAFNQTKYLVKLYILNVTTFFPQAIFFSQN